MPAETSVGTPATIALTRGGRKAAAGRVLEADRDVRRGQQQPSRRLVLRPRADLDSGLGRAHAGAGPWPPARPAPRGRPRGGRLRGRRAPRARLVVAAHPGPSRRSRGEGGRRPCPGRRAAARSRTKSVKATRPRLPSRTRSFIGSSEGSSPPRPLLHLPGDEGAVRTVSPPGLGEVRAGAPSLRGLGARERVQSPAPRGARRPAAAAARGARRRAQDRRRRGRGRGSRPGSAGPVTTSTGISSRRSGTSAATQPASGRGVHRASLTSRSP